LVEVFELAKVPFKKLLELCIVDIVEGSPIELAH
jgi:hypothetical protein